MNLLKASNPTIEEELPKSKFAIYANNKLLVIKAGMDKISKIVYNKASTDTFKISWEA